MATPKISKKMDRAVAVLDALVESTGKKGFGRGNGARTMADRKALRSASHVPELVPAAEKVLRMSAKAARLLDDDAIALDDDADDDLFFLSKSEVKFQDNMERLERAHPFWDETEMLLDLLQITNHHHGDPASSSDWQYLDLRRQSEVCKMISDAGDGATEFRADLYGQNVLERAQAAAAIPVTHKVMRPETNVDALTDLNRKHLVPFTQAFIDYAATFTTVHATPALTYWADHQDDFPLLTWFQWISALQHEVFPNADRAAQGLALVDLTPTPHEAAILAWMNGDGPNPTYQ
jgi:hypothetical protein